MGGEETEEGNMSSWRGEETNEGKIELVSQCISMEAESLRWAISESNFYFVKNELFSEEQMGVKGW